MDQSCKYLIAGQTKDKYTDAAPYFWPSRDIAKSEAELTKEWYDELYSFCMDPARQGDRDRYYAKCKEMDANFIINFRKSSLQVRDNFENN